ncbi:MAG: hypothetical protein M3O82_05375 [Verrucomicrobiota bacterium]|nr:hypothetical protein [Verrucomicrobiota bacterium]
MPFSQATAFEFLQRAHLHQKLAHAYLITGATGSGKRTLIEQLCALVTNAKPNEKPLEHPDVHVAEPESKSRRIVIEQVRTLEKGLQMRSLRGGKKVGIIFEADRLQPQASNAFLKTLEEPPDHSLLLLATSLPEALLETIRSRCIPVPLRATERVAVPPLQARLLEKLRDHAAIGRWEIAHAFRLVREFTQLLQESRQIIAGEHDETFKGEENRYKEATGNSDWLDDREAHFKVLTESRYRQAREMLVETLVQWWADSARHQQGDQHLDYAEFSKATAAIGAKFSTAEVLRRIATLDELRENLDRNIQEQLAIEVAFLKVFTS